MANPTAPLLSVRDLTIMAGQRPLICHCSWHVQAGEILIIVGESGSGKTTLLKTAAGIPDQDLACTDGEIAYAGVPLKRPSDWQALRSRDMQYLFQDALSSFCPVRTVYDQLWDAARFSGMPKDTFDQVLADRTAVLSLRSDALKTWPQNLSGGMIQRAELLFSLIQPPRLLFADEPTSAVDSVTQKKMAQALLRLRRHHRTAIVLVTHDIRLAAFLADTLLILKAGEIVEYGPAASLLAQPRSEYTRRLLTLSGLKGGDLHASGN